MHACIHLYVYIHYLYIYALCVCVCVFVCPYAFVLICVYASTYIIVWPCVRTIIRGDHPQQILRKWVIIPAMTCRSASQTMVIKGEWLRSLSSKGRSPWLREVHFHEGNVGPRPAQRPMITMIMMIMIMIMYNM